MLQQRQLSTIPSVENPRLFVWPPLPLPKPLPGAKPNVQDPLVKSDPWKVFVVTPIKSQRGHDVHSGMTPQLHNERQTLEDFLAGTEASMTAIPAPPMPQSNGPESILQVVLEGKNALLQGVNEMPANMVTTQTPAKFHELQSRDMQTYVQAE